MKPLNALTAVTAEDPYEFYRRLADQRPFGWDADAQLWVAASASAVKAVLEHPALRVRPPGEPVPRVIAGTPAGRLFGRFMRMTDGEYHDPLKRAATHALAVFENSDLRSWIDLCARAFEGDDVGSWMFVFPVYTMAGALGFSAHEATEAAHATATLVRGASANAGGGEVRRASAAAQTLSAHVDALLAGGSRTPLLSAFGEATRGSVPHDAIVANAVGFLFQTLDATAALIGNALCALVRAPSAQRFEKGTLLSERARFDPPVHSTRRFAAADVELFDCHVAAGDTVVVLLAAANQDPAAPSFTFGSGGHACPAQTVAMMIAQAAVESVIERIGLAQLHVDGYRPSPNCRIPEFA